MNNNEIQNVIGSNIRALRNAKEIHRDTFAETIGIEGGHLYRIEEGFHWPSAKIIINVCKNFNVSADKLLGLDN